MMTETADGISLLLVLRDNVSHPAAWVGRWSETLSRSNRPHQLIVIRDGSPSDELGRLENITVIQHEKPLGFGACVRVAIELAVQPVFGYVGSDYPYEPSDLAKLLKEFGQHNADLNMTVDVVGGCRTGIAVPQPWKTLGALKRGFDRFALGNPTEPLPGWYGLSEHLSNRLTRTKYGNPFHDVNCAFKLFRTSRVKTIPIQCDDDGVHIELVAKLTFLTTLMAEVPLAPKPDAIPKTIRDGLKAVSSTPRFRIEPQTPAPIEINAAPVAS